MSYLLYLIGIREVVHRAGGTMGVELKGSDCFIMKQTRNAYIVAVRHSIRKAISDIPNIAASGFAMRYIR